MIRRYLKISALKKIILNFKILNIHIFTQNIYNLFYEKRALSAVINVSVTITHCDNSESQIGRCEMDCVKENFKLRSCNLYYNKYMIASTKIANTETYAFIAVLVFLSY